MCGGIWVSTQVIWLWSPCARCCTALWEQAQGIMRASTPLPIWIMGHPASSWGLPGTDGKLIPSLAQALPPEISQKPQLSKVWLPVVNRVGPYRSLFPGLQCLWPHSEVFQGLKARKRETKEGIKSRNVP